LDCGGLTPLSFFGLRWLDTAFSLFFLSPGWRTAKKKATKHDEPEKKESGVEPPQSKGALRVLANQKRKKAASSRRSPKVNGKLLPSARLSPHCVSER
jgi:hypothetical protein